MTREEKVNNLFLFCQVKKIVLVATWVKLQITVILLLYQMRQLINYIRV